MKQNRDELIKQLLISNEDFDFYLKGIFEESKRDIKASDPFSTIVAIFHKRKDEERLVYHYEMNITKEIFESDDLSTEYFRKIGAELVRKDLPPVVALFHIGEAWLYELNNIKQKDHKDCLVVTGMTLDNRVNQAIVFIEPDLSFGEEEITLYSSEESENRESKILGEIYTGYSTEVFKRHS